MKRVISVALMLFLFVSGCGGGSGESSPASSEVPSNTSTSLAVPDEQVNICPGDPVDYPVEPWNSVTYGSGTFVAVRSGNGSSYPVMASSDGAAWTCSAVNQREYWTDVAYGNSKFLAVGGFSESTMTSTSGTSWTVNTVNEGRWKSVAFGNGRFVGVRDSVPNGRNVEGYIPFGDTVDGVSWNVGVFTDSKLDFDWTSIAFGNGVFVATGSRRVGEPGGTFGYDPAITHENSIAVSTDGRSWSFPNSVPSTFENPIIEFGQNVFRVFSRSSERILTSSNGMSWVWESLPKPVDAITAASNMIVAFANGTATYGGPFKGVQGEVLTSIKGASWVMTPYGDTSLSSSQLSSYQAAVYGGGKFVAVGNGSSPAMSSTDGLNWRRSEKTASTASSSTSLSSSPTTSVSRDPDTGDWFIPFQGVALAPQTPFKSGDWIAVLASIDEKASKDQKIKEVEAASLRRGEVYGPMFVLRSADYPNLKPGYIVVYEGEFRSEAEATKFCRDAGQQVPSQCYARLLMN